MTERLEIELLGDRGFQDVLAVINCAARLSNALRPNDDPGVMTSGDGPGAPYSKPLKRKVKVRCTNWMTGCEVRNRRGEKSCLLLRCSSAWWLV